ncbi:MAG TPA: adenylate kinase [Acidimicrobiia bacterium]
MRLLLIGPPGSGKGTQAERLAKIKEIAHISTGEMFREQMEAGTDLGKRVKDIVESGAYVPDEVTVEMLAERLAAPDAQPGFILDGFPRTLPQLSALDGLLGETGLDRVVVLEVDDDLLLGRMLQRGRDDDTEGTIRGRFELYRDQTAPLIEIYEQRGLVSTVDGGGTIEEVTDRIVEALGG